MPFWCLLNKMVSEEEAEDFRDEKDGGCSGLGCALEMFSEHGEVMTIIEKLKSIYEDMRAVELSTERLIFILDRYQEQPHLLDPYLDSMLNSIINIIRDPENPKSLKDLAFWYIRHIMKVRGFKTVVRHLPHEVYDLEPVLQMLENQDSNLGEASYVLLLWLSIIVKVPFHMSRFDDYTVEESAKPKTVAERILDVCKNYICRNSYYTIPVAFLTAHFITRCDIYGLYLDGFLEWLYKALDSIHEHATSQEINCVTSLATLASILKHGKREDLIPFARPMLKKILESDLKISTNTLHRKYAMKITQRIGLVFLKPKVATWRYQRGHRSLAENLKKSESRPNPDGDSNAIETPKAGETEEIYVPDEIEEVIEYLLQGLRDPETVIRWSAAKGIGRVTGRLPKELADEVVENILELLSPNEQDNAWHGGCLTLAELGRRGLLLPQRLPLVVPLLLKALVYEDSRGYYSIGDHVRDAACYVAWSFARAYEPNVLKPYVNSIASGLLIVSLFDREVKCRRAASAAFQENVGRQGTFPHGIDIVTTADYFSVGMRQNSFLKISVFIGQFEEYMIPLIDHLVGKKVDHWDVAIRELTALALHNMTRLNPDYMLDCVIPNLLKKTKSIDLNCRHGSVIAIAEIIHALKLFNKDVSEEVANELRQLIYDYREKNYFSGMGGEILRQGFCKLIEKCSLSAIPFHKTQIIDDWQQLLDECLVSEVMIIRSKAVAALQPFFIEYYQSNDDEVVKKRESVVNRYITELSSLNQTARLGYSMAIGNFPRFMLADKINNMISALLESFKITEYTLKWAESRRDAIKALISVISTVGIESLNNEEETEDDSSEMSNQSKISIATTVGNKTMAFPVVMSKHRRIQEIFSRLLIGLDDYTNDSRGDIGAWVREACMSGLQKMIILTAGWNKELLTESLMSTVIGGIGKQAVERIDRTRLHAGRIFNSIIHHNDPVIPNIPYHEKLLEIFPENCFTKDFINENDNESFPKFVKMLSFPCYTHYILEGFILSVGGITERLVKYSSTSIITYLKSIEDPKELNRICSTILNIFEQNQHNNRVISPLFVFLDRILGSGVIREILEDSNNKFAEELLRLTIVETTKIRDYRKLINSMDLFCQLVQVKGKVSTKALSQMSIFLCHRFKAVRKEAATKLYECLLLYGDCSSVPEENLDEVMTLLSDTNWDKEPDEIRPARNHLCELVKIPIPRLIKTSVAN